MDQSHLGRSVPPSTHALGASSHDVRDRAWFFACQQAASLFCLVGSPHREEGVTRNAWIAVAPYPIRFAIDRELGRLANERELPPVGEPGEIVESLSPIRGSPASKAADTTGLPGGGLGVTDRMLPQGVHAGFAEFHPSLLADLAGFLAIAAPEAQVAGSCGTMVEWDEAACLAAGIWTLWNAMGSQPRGRLLESSASLGAALLHSASTFVGALSVPPAEVRRDGQRNDPGGGGPPRRSFGSV